MIDKRRTKWAIALAALYLLVWFSLLTGAGYVLYLIILALLKYLES